ncbi:hypothetical protein RO1_00140 [Roseburia intestinalis XB6B4]|uniref:Uncharacterized protein n=1 Tax=Roseburia intestinalis XB6B4 TaxID=718255 RepID=D4KU16_9FIRM|nr:hypothetical protein RO1_00140 [Roseburia intestinalis XB6B4]
MAFCADMGFQTGNTFDASCAFFPHSAFSTAFQSVSRSAYSGGAWDGSRISEQITPPLRV